MTLAVAMRVEGAIILAADSRGTIGDPRGLTAISDNHVKIFGIGKCGLALAGASEMGAALLDELRKKGVDAVADIDAARDQIVSECAQLFAGWFREIPPEKRPAVLMILAGYRFPVGKTAEPMIYLLNSQTNFAPQLFNTPCMAGVPQYAVYLVHRYYAPTIAPDRAKCLAEYLITETASQDPKVGGPVRMAEITPDNGYGELDQNEVDTIHQENESLNEKLRQFYLAGGTE